MLYILWTFWFMPVRSHQLPYLLPELAISYIWTILIRITTRLAWGIAWIIFAAVIIEVVRLISVVTLEGVIQNRDLAFVVRPDFEIACGALRSCRHLCWDLIAFYLIIVFHINFVSNEVTMISRRLMCKNETLFLFRRHCLIHYNGIIIIIILLF